MGGPAHFGLRTGRTLGQKGPRIVDAPQPPSIFLSYASADRAAARRLRDTLAKAGLDVWLDEEELTGGDAWDAKIRQQIRTCTYFMPVISATTDSRREGYFRREWRQAVERTLDFADDVTFLVPVVIDDTPDATARVPEKFTAVQWLRCPGGEETPVLAALALRLIREHQAHEAGVTAGATRPPVLVPGVKPAAASARVHPFPVFPAFPAPGHRFHFVYELAVWTGRMIYALWVRLPRWLQVAAMVLIVFKLPSLLSTNRSPAAPRAPDPDFTPAAEKQLGETLSTLGAGLVADVLQTGRPVALIPFTLESPALQPVAADLLGVLRERIGQDHGGAVAVSATPFASTPNDDALAVRAAVLKSSWLITGVVRPDPAGFAVEVILYDAKTKTRAWQTVRQAATAESKTVAADLARDLLGRVTF